MLQFILGLHMLFAVAVVFKRGHFIQQYTILLFGCNTNVDIDTAMNMTPTIHQVLNKVLMLIKTTFRKQDNNICINTNCMHISLIRLYIM